jgi:hypothetical protein
MNMRIPMGWLAIGLVAYIAALLLLYQSGQYDALDERVLTGGAYAAR